MLTNARKVVGAQQTRSAILAGEAAAVYVALDADEHVTRPVRELAVSRGVEIREVPSKKELGKSCGIERSASCAAELTI